LIQCWRIVPFDKDLILELILSASEDLLDLTFHQILGLDEALLDTLRGVSQIMDDHIHKKFLFRVLLFQVMNVFLKLVDVHASF
jgi:hypothetical protein